MRYSNHIPWSLGLLDLAVGTKSMPRTLIMPFGNPSEGTNKYNIIQLDFGGMLYTAFTRHGTLLREVLVALKRRGPFASYGHKHGAAEGSFRSSTAKQFMRDSGQAVYPSNWDRASLWCLPQLSLQGAATCQHRRHCTADLGTKPAAAAPCWLCAAGWMTQNLMDGFDVFQDSPQPIRPFHLDISGFLIFQQLQQ